VNADKTSGFDVSKFQSKLKDQIELLNTRPFLLNSVVGEWFNQAVELRKGAANLIPIADAPSADFEMLTHLLVTWCDLRGAPDATSLREFLDAVRISARSTNEADADAIGTEINRKFRQAASIVERLINLSIALGGAPKATDGFEPSELHQNAIQAIREAKKPLRSYEAIAKAAGYPSCNSHFRSEMGHLQSLGLIEKTKAGYVLKKSGQLSG